MDLYEYTSLLLPLILFHFCIDFLSDRDIVKDETKIGIIQFFHHTVCTIYTFGITILPFININISVLVLVIFVSICTQIGYLINNEYCWLTKIVNKMINPYGSGRRKWTGSDIPSLVKSYLRDSDWRYSDMRNLNNNNLMLITNTVHIIILLKFIKINL